MPRVRIEKRLPPFWNPSFDFFEVFWFCFPWHLVHLAEGFFRFALIVRLVPEVFGSNLLEGRSPLAFVLHLLCVCGEGFLVRTF